MEEKKIKNKIGQNSDNDRAANDDGSREGVKEQCNSDTKKKIRIKKNNFLYYSIKIWYDLYMK